VPSLLHSFIPLLCVSAVLLAGATDAGMNMDLSTWCLSPTMVGI
jgi:hypothetical protein